MVTALITMVTSPNQVEESLRTVGHPMLGGHPMMEGRNMMKGRSMMEGRPTTADHPKMEDHLIMVIGHRTAGQRLLLLHLVTMATMSRVSKGE